MSLSASLKAALKAGQRIDLLEIDLPPSGTTHYAMGGVISASQGQYLGRLLSISPVARRITDEWSGAYPNVDVTALLDDSDRAFAQIARGANADSIKGSAVRWKVAATDVDAGDWHTAFSGRLVDWGWPTRFVAELAFQQDDLKINRPTPNAGWKITPAVWPNAHESARNEWAPVLYGEHDSEPYTAVGFIPCLLVDTVTMRHLICAGRAKTVATVYIDGVPTTNHTVDYHTRGGRLFTTLTWSTAPATDAVITADVDGYEVTGDGTGALITNPITQLEHMASNFVFGDYMSGNWLSAASELDSTTWTALETYFTTQGWGSAYHLPEPREFRALLEEFAKSWEVRVYWTAAGKIGVGVEDPTRTTIYLDSPWIRDLGEELAWGMPRAPREAITALTVDHVFDAGTKDYKQSLELREPTRDEVREEIEHPWSPSVE